MWNIILPSIITGGVTIFAGIRLGMFGYKLVQYNREYPQFEKKISKGLIFDQLCHSYKGKPEYTEIVFRPILLQEIK